MSVAYQAYGKAGQVTADTPRAAAVAYFDRFPSSRKCNVMAGTVDGPFFTVTVRLGATNGAPQSWRDVTKRGALELPEVQP